MYHFADFFSAAIPPSAFNVSSSAVLHISPVIISIHSKFKVNHAQQHYQALPL